MNATTAPKQSSRTIKVVIHTISTVSSSILLFFALYSFTYHSRLSPPPFNNALDTEIFLYQFMITSSEIVTCELIFFVLCWYQLRSFQEQYEKQNNHKINIACNFICRSWAATNTTTRSSSKLINLNIHVSFNMCIYFFLLFCSNDGCIVKERCNSD